MPTGPPPDWLLIIRVTLEVIWKKEAPIEPFFFRGEVSQLFSLSYLLYSPNVFAKFVFFLLLFCLSDHVLKAPILFQSIFADKEVLMWPQTSCVQGFPLSVQRREHFSTCILSPQFPT